MLLKLRASPAMLPFSLCKKKRLAVRHMNRPPLSNDTIDSVQRHREVGRAKDLAEPPHNKSSIISLKISILGGAQQYGGEWMGVGSDNSISLGAHLALTKVDENNTGNSVRRNLNLLHWDRFPMPTLFSVSPHRRVTNIPHHQHPYYQEKIS